MRQLAPISPAIHLGAHRVLVVGTGFSQSLDLLALEHLDDMPAQALAYSVYRPIQAGGAAR